jgi:hypothetical protein
MRDRRPLLIAARLALGAAALALAGAAPLACFDLKKPPCAFSCAKPPHTCPQNYTCGDDGLCYRDGADPEKCLLIPPEDAGGDAGTDAE